MVVRVTRSILYVANAAKIGGGNRVLMDLMQGLDRGRYAPILVAPDAGPLTEWAGDSGIPCHVVKSSGPSRGAAPVRAARLAGLIVRRRAAIVHAIDPQCYREVSWAAALTGARRVCHIQFPPDPQHLRWVFRVRPHLTISCYREHINDVLAVVPELGDAATALSNAVRMDAFHAHEGAGSAWHFGRGKMVIIVGHLSDIKGHPTFVRAAALIKHAYPDCAFVVLGQEMIQPGFERTLRELADAIGVGPDLHFLGWRSNVAEIVSGADAFVLPSLKEGLPLAMLEAMACGVPVVATPVNGIPEVIQHNVNGLLIPVGDARALAESVVRLLVDPEDARRLGSAGQDTVRRNYSMPSFMADIQERYDRLLAGTLPAAPAISTSPRGTPADSAA